MAEKSDRFGSSAASGDIVQSLRFHKRGDLIADALKQLIVSEGMRPGDKLPSEHRLTEMFQVGKASVREALKSLEVQGLVQSSTGPTGGTFIADVSEIRILNHLHSYFYFKNLTAAQVYEARLAFEPALARHIAKIADASLLQRLAENMKKMNGPIDTRDDWQRMQKIHIEFHELLAGAGSNQLLCMNCKFINRSLKGIVRVRESPNQVDIIKSNCRWHEQIYEAVEAHDAEKAGSLMYDHIHELAEAYKGKDTILRNRLHLETQAMDEVSALHDLP
ncbi:MAG: FadR family transcriptional regulator [Nitratireductor sp.]|nr:FadR family transcriptional regulator [Nitratireductor sp.]